jgi:hypothetical protein
MIVLATRDEQLLDARTAWDKAKALPRPLPDGAAVISSRRSARSSHRRKCKTRRTPQPENSARSGPWRPPNPYRGETFRGRPTESVENFAQCTVSTTRNRAGGVRERSQDAVHRPARSTSRLAHLLPRVHPAFVSGGRQPPAHCPRRRSQSWTRSLSTTCGSMGFSHRITSAN